MRLTSSYNEESLRTRAFQIWKAHQDATFRPTLNLKALSALLQNALIGNDPNPLTTRKRSASPSPPAQRSSKRQRQHQLQTEFDIAGEVVAELPVVPESPYPYLRTNYSQRSGDRNHDILAFHHTFTIRYNPSIPDNDVNSQSVVGLSWKEMGWEDEEHDFKRLLQRLGPNETVIPLGRVNFAEYHGRVVAAHEQKPGFPTWLALLPPMIKDTDLQAHDLRLPSSDLLLACMLMQGAGRLFMHGETTLATLHLDGDLTFELRVDMYCSLVFPLILERLNKGSEVVESAQRFLLDHIYPSQPATPASFQGDINIPYFYSILNPAPNSSSRSVDEAIQPLNLLPTLLPFQRRSVAWLLNRDGKSVSPDGSLVPRTTSGDYTFWDEIAEANQSFYRNRLTGELSQELPEAEPSIGGVLAEEPGLGKTVEVIALCLLNPAPETRNPSVIKWNVEAAINTKAVKTTLIVTPPSLACQWADELAAHAPSLKVLVYEGWGKVTIPITERQVEEERTRRLLLKKKKKARKAAIASGKQKETKKPAKKKKTRKTGSGSKTGSDNDENEDSASEGGDGDEGDNDEEIIDWCHYVHKFDVVITTYAVLRADLNVARAVPKRPRRQDVVYSDLEQPRSPLIMVEWYRVIMDEVQMVGGGKAEDMVALIPRLASFAVSGTPVRAKIEDFVHVLKFLRINHLVGKNWKRLLTPGYAGEFAAFVQRYAIRTMKSTVKDELTIPQQTRYLVKIELGRVERHVYDQSLERALQELGLDARGVAASSNWEVDGTALRNAIRRLRGLCTHPQVGQLQDKLYKPGALKSMEEVLQGMRDLNWRTVMDDWKLKVQCLIRMSQLQNKDERDRNRYQHALETIQRAEKDTENLLTEVLRVLEEHDVRGEEMKQAALALRNDSTNKAVNSDATAVNGKGKGRDVSPTPSNGDEESSEDGLPRTPAGEEHGIKRRALQLRMRECRIVLHRVKFLEGDLFHTLGMESEENAAYAAAEEIRRDLLKGSADDAVRAMEQLASNAQRKHLSKEIFLVEVPFLEAGGIRSDLLVDEGNSLIEDVLNVQVELLWKWRSHILTLLTQSLLTRQDEADGQEYQRTLDNQGEAETYLQAYAAILADYREALFNERTLLAAHDVREKKLRHTKAAIKAAAVAEAAKFQAFDEVEIQPEHEVLHKDLSDQRKALLVLLKGRALKSIMVDLNKLSIEIKKEHPEKTLAQNAASNIRRLIGEQGALLDKLDTDLAMMRKAFNQRILYFRQLQEISDSVTEATWDSTLAAALADCTLERNQLEARINTNRARQRYLDNLQTTQEAESDDDDEEKTCILCRCDFVRGFMTHCAHIFCEDCMKAWLVRREGRTCPVCRVPINPDTIQRFTVDERKAEAPPQPINGEPAPRSRRQISYNMMEPEVFESIQMMETFGDFGSKIQTLVRHILYLERQDPGSKSIIFSAWADSLHIMEFALKHNGVGCLRIDQSSKKESAAKKFAQDPTIPVLLLHGERENAGLNVTCASRVFLMESVVHHGFEIQAIARIDRMGQRRPTEVYCYYAEDTVERNILDLAARQGLSLYTKNNSAGSVSVSSFAMNDEENKVVEAKKKNAKAQKGDFISKIDDMLAILFPHMYEDVEYLIPEGDAMDVDMQDAGTSSGEPPLPVEQEDGASTAQDNVDSPIIPPRRQLRPRHQENAVAGPSRAQ